MVRGKAIVSVSRPISAHQVALLDDYRARRAAVISRPDFGVFAVAAAPMPQAAASGSIRRSCRARAVIHPYARRCPRRRRNAACETFDCLVSPFLRRDSTEAMTAVFVHGMPETPVVCAACRLRWTTRPETRKRARCDRSPSAIIGLQEA